MGVGYPPDALPDAPLGVRARISRARALWVLGGEALSVRATSWGAHSGVHPVQVPNAITNSGEYLRAKVEFETWFASWSKNRVALKPDPADMRRHMPK